MHESRIISRCGKMKCYKTNITMWAVLLDCLINYSLLDKLTVISNFDFVYSLFNCAAFWPYKC